MIYLDHNATTPVDPEVEQAVCSALRLFGNPSSTHRHGREAHGLIEDARGKVARLINARPDEIIFTSGGTESNNIALSGYAALFGAGHVITSAIEHPSVLNPLLHLREKGFRITLVPVDKNGKVSLDKLAQAIDPDTILITVMHANNETGVIQPLDSISEIARERGIVLHTDAAQSAGKITLDVNNPSVDMMTIASHKFYGPKGVGALFIRRGIELRQIIFGAGQERGLSPGTENTPGIAGLGKAGEIAVRDLRERQDHAERLVDLLHETLKGCRGDIRVNGGLASRLPNTINISIPGIYGFQLLDRVKETIGASTSAACHAGKNVPSQVLKAMGLTDEEALSSMRFSVGKDNTEEEIIEAATILNRTIQELTGR